VQDDPGLLLAGHRHRHNRPVYGQLTGFFYFGNIKKGLKIGNNFKKNGKNRFFIGFLTRLFS
jgi:hypothetical protein